MPDETPQPSKPHLMPYAPPTLETAADFGSFSERRPKNIEEHLKRIREARLRELRGPEGAAGKE